MNCDKELQDDNSFDSLESAHVIVKERENRTKKGMPKRNGNFFGGGI